MSGGYRDGDAPWRFTGRALYQLNLVKSSEARKHVPGDLKPVELFGYTLGGVSLARYEDSPAGTFDEMVALGGLVWNPPTSCAWAARVFVNDAGARAHGVKTCGLPSRLAQFDHGNETEQPHGWWKNKKPPSVLAKARAFVVGGWRTRPEKGKTKTKTVSEAVTLRDGTSGGDLCSLAIPSAGAGPLGPRINLKLPSFSGRTQTVPDLLKYSLDLRANVRLSGPVVMKQADLNIETNSKTDEEEKTSDDEKSFWAPKGDVRFPPALAAASLSLTQTPSGVKETTTDTKQARKPKQTVDDAELVAILKGKPLLCIAFDKMEMDVGAPVKVVK